MIVKIVTGTRKGGYTCKFFAGNQISIVPTIFAKEAQRTVAECPTGGFLELSQILLEKNDTAGLEAGKPCIVIAMSLPSGWKQIGTNGVVYLLNDSGDTIETFYTKGN